MDKKELEKRIQELREYYEGGENFENMEAEYVELIYEIGEEANKGENDDTK